MDDDKIELQRAVSVTELLSRQMKTLPFDGEWKAAMGEPEMRGSWLIWGNSGNGKTRFALQLAKYLTQFGRVAYNSLEEGVSVSFRRAIIAVGMQEVKNRFVLLDQEPMEQLMIRLAKHKSPDIVIIDSLQYTGLRYDAYKELRRRFPKKLFIFISHAEGKDPEGRVAKRVRFDAFVKIWVEGYRAQCQSRYGGGEPYIIWREGYDKYWDLN